ncbi:MAG TPA: RAD55 family ATPase [Candidatus Binatia bacterium]|nr:RAD55 family ATPase [Candidatus Binatia bacterium]
MIKTGCPAIDRILNGKLPDKSVVLIERDPGMKDSLERLFLHNTAKKGVGYYAYFNETNKEIEDAFKEQGLDITKQLTEKRLFWIDESNHENAGENVINCKIDELFTVELAMLQLLESNKDKKIRGVIHLLTPALMANEPVLIYQFFSYLVNTLKKYNTLTIFLIEQNLHDATTLKAIESLCDVVIETKLVSEEFVIKTLVRVKKMKGNTDTKFHALRNVTC